MQFRNKNIEILRYPNHLPIAPVIGVVVYLEEVQVIQWTRAFDLQGPEAPEPRNISHQPNNPHNVNSVDCSNMRGFMLE